MMLQIPLTKDLLLIGGGHTHALVLNMWAMKPLAGVRVTLVTPSATAPYSGMLPGYIAGHYRRGELDIDLVKLAARAGVQLVFGQAIGIDPKKKQARILTGSGETALAYDAISINVGIQYQMPQIDGFAKYAVAAKPLDIYADAWARFMAVSAKSPGAKNLAIIGAGIAGCELALASAHALKAINCAPNVTLIEGAGKITGIGRGGAGKLMRELQNAGIKLHLNTKVIKIGDGVVHTESGLEIAADFILGAAGAQAHSWIEELSFEQTNGALDVGPDLQLTEHPDHFAAGDCAYLTHAPRPKAGVFAVRAAPVLFHNLRAALSGEKLHAFKPQKDYLKLISLGDKRALGEKFGWVFHGRYLWRLKNAIDQKFMRKFSAPKPMKLPTIPPETASGVSDILAQSGPALCGACGGKVTPGALEDALTCTKFQPRDDVLSGPGDDAAILRNGDGYQIITTDHLRSFWDDPALMTRITCLHALGDVWAMGADAQAGLLNVTLPRMSPQLQARTMAQITQAAADVLQNAGAALVGGHSTMGAEMTIGLTITGTKDSAPITQSGARPGDAIVLTRPIGTGVILAAHMRAQAEGKTVENLITALMTPQMHAAHILKIANALTDVTGFGLAGHLHAICKKSNCGAKLTLEAIPIWPGALELAQKGIVSSLFAGNRAHAPIEGAHGAKADLLYDPQTAGGFLAAIAPQDVPQVIEALKASGCTGAIIGQFTDQTGQLICT